MNSTITLTGNLTREPELKFGDNGLARVRFGLASTRRVKERETTSYYDVIAFGKTAENIHASLAKGAAAIITGRLEVKDFERKDGTKGTAAEIVAEDVGALLKFATVSIQKNEKGTSSAPAGTNPWDEEDF